MASEISAEEMAIMREMCMEGDVAAQFALGRFLKEIPQRGEPGEFQKWLTMAAENGSGPACWEFAEAYLYGVGVEQDYAAAHTWLKKGAELNGAACLYNLKNRVPFVYCSFAALVLLFQEETRNLSRQLLS